MKEPSLRVIPHQQLSDTGRLRGGMTLDMDQKDCVDKFRRLLHRQQSNPSPDRRAGVNRRRKPHSIKSVVDDHGNARANLNRLLDEITDQRQGEKTMGNGGPERRFALSALWVQVNPLAILAGLGKFLDAVLGDNKPACRVKFASFELFQRI